MLLMDKVCIIAGAASLRSIGYATAELFVEHGAKVVVTDVSMNADVLESIKTSIEKHLQRSISIDGIQCDISKKEACDALVAEVVRLHGRIDCMVNSAGIVRSSPILEIQEKELDLMFDINLKGAERVAGEITAAGGAAPKPRKLRPAVARIAAPACSSPRSASGTRGILRARSAMFRVPVTP